MFKFGPRLALDFGSYESRFYLAGKGVVRVEPTLLAVDEDNRVLALGREAEKMLGKTPTDIHLSRPVQRGRITDYNLSQLFLSYFFKLLASVNWFIRPEVLISIPASLTPVEKTALIEATLASGARVVHLVNQPIAAALGLQIPLAEPQGNLILSFGGGVSEISLVSMGNVIAVRQAEWGSSDIDQAIVDHFLKKHKLIIGQKTAEKIKLVLGSPLPLTLAEKEGLKRMSKEDSLFLRGDELFIEVGGRDEFTDLPRRVKISADEITQVISEQMKILLKIIAEIMHNIPPELITDVMDKGIVIIGGGALLRHLSEFLTSQVAIPCYLADDPASVIIRGSGQVVENLDYFNAVLS